ncbi:MAG: TetR/AcrR family transcriptional regulator [Acidimicrobiaceae bacterium]|nr:TetR/AcrR family transcriptional regulator [Acidimicrobiaceae bacterium]MYL04898.1 TetR/AcrR family transcriptional regulator [Acidimicrobiaceae bacterium]
MTSHRGSEEPGDTAAEELSPPSGTARRSPNPRGRPPGDTAARTKQALLKSARQVFAEFGYHGATIAEITRRAEVSTPVLYHHFGSKAGLYSAVMAEVTQLLAESWGKTIAGTGDLRSKVNAMFDTAIDIHAADPELARFLLATRLEVTRTPELVAVSEYRDFTAGLFRSVALQSGVDADRASAVAHVLAAFFAGLTVIAVASPFDYDTAAESLRSLLDSELFDS